MSQALESNGIVYRGRRFQVEELVQPLAGGGQHLVQVVRHPGAVVVLPILEDGRLCLIRNFRVSVARWLIELPAGTREPGEPTDVTALRELQEETGYVSEKAEHVHTFLLTPGICDEAMQLFLARDCRPGPNRLEPGEQIENLLVTHQQAAEMIQRREIEDAKTLVGLMWYLAGYLPVAPSA
jgi:ADP-ribose pyrophosphatase